MDDEETTTVAGSGEPSGEHGQDTEADAPETSSQAPPAQSVTYDYVKFRASLRRRLTNLLKVLNTEYGKSSPSARYLKKYLADAEGIVKQIEEVVEDHRNQLRDDADFEGLEKLEKWFEKLNEDCSPLAEVSSLLESGVLESASQPSGDGDLSAQPLEEELEGEDFAHSAPRSADDGGTEFSGDPGVSSSLRACSDDDASVVTMYSTGMYHSGVTDGCSTAVPWQTPAAAAADQRDHAIHGAAQDDGTVGDYPDSRLRARGALALRGSPGMQGRGSSADTSSGTRSSLQPPGHAVHAATFTTASVTQSSVLVGQPQHHQHSATQVSSAAYVASAGSGTGTPGVAVNRVVSGAPSQTQGQGGGAFRARAMPSVQQRPHAKPVTAFSSSVLPPLPSAHAAKTAFPSPRRSAAPRAYRPSAQAAAPSAHSQYQTQYAQPAAPHISPYGHSWLKPIEVPKFSGKGRDYIQWRQRFLQVADSSLPEEYQMARLREAVAGGEAAILIEDLLDGPGAYDAAWAELESWFGGTDRHLEQQIRDLLNHPRVTNERDVEGLQQYAVKLRSLIANMKLCGSEPGPELCIIATEKVPRTTLIRYFERHGDGNTDIKVFATWLLEKVKTAKYANDRTEQPDRQPSHGKRHHEAVQRPVQQRSFIGTEATAPKRPQEAPIKTSGHSKTQQQARQKCRKCNGPHQLANCNEFKALSTSRRNELVRLLNLCLCCLREGHWARDCNAASGCPHCRGKHHSLLHESKPSLPSSKAAASTSPAASENTAHATAATDDSNAGLTSFMVTQAEVRGGTAKATANVLLDSGSSCSYVSERLARRLRLGGSRKKVSVGVIGGGAINDTLQVVTLAVQHDGGDKATELEAYVLPRVTTDLRLVNWKEIQDNWAHLRDVSFKTAGDNHLDLLIGLNSPVLHRADEERHGGDGDPIARKTPLGWVCFGPVLCPSTPTHSTFHAVTTAGTNLDHLVSRFWDLEAVGMLPKSDQYLTPDEQQAVTSTQRTLNYKDGRFEVGIPWKDGAKQPDVTSNKVLAENRLRALMRSLQRRPGMLPRYAKVLEDYLQKSYIRKLTTEEVEQCGSSQCYLPHFAVIREDKATTKVRVVFDAAARANNVAVNDLMLAGPKLQADLVKLLIRFCLEPIALMGDVSEMFLQVSLSPEDRRYHRFLWQPGETVETYEFMRLVFGIKASPYLAGRALQATAERFGDQYDPIASDIVRDSFYVDDLLKSLRDVQQAILARVETQALLKRGGFTLRKWLSNSPEVMASIPAEERAAAESRSIAESPSHPEVSQKALGVKWMVKGDYFTFHYKGSSPTVFTKRSVLSRMATLFDPRGQLSPFTIRAKIMFQELCLSGIGWDDTLPDAHLASWSRWFSEFDTLSHLKIRRCFKGDDWVNDITVHVFTDASALAYAAAAYVRVAESDGGARVTLIMAKARPAPIKRRTIPQLELQGAVLGARLGQYVSGAVGVGTDDVNYWTDSMNVLYWVRSLSRKFKVDVGNRISEIQRLSRPAQWQHVPGKENPADLPTRGLSAQQLVERGTWWSGPRFLSFGADQWPKKMIAVPSVLPCMQVSKVATAMVSLHAVECHPAETRLDPGNYSAWPHLLRVTAWCRRFIHCLKSARAGEQAYTSTGEAPVVEVNLGSQCSSLNVPELSAAEVDSAEQYWVARSQRDQYPDVYHTLMSGKELPSSSPLVKLRPFLDSSAEVPVLRVGGRLRTAHHLASEFRCPLILPQKHRVTELIIAEEDRQCSHSIGTNHLLSKLADKFWIVKGRQTVKRYRQACVGCKRLWNKPYSPAMGPLPNFRTEGQLLAFSRTAVDFAGPFYVKRGRGRVQEKRYAAIFTCLQTRACHFEVVYSLDTDGFKMALVRFTKRRGTPTMILSDNGTNFVGTERELREAVQSLGTGDVSAALAAQGTQWVFNPPRAPHTGGVFERVVRSLKQVLQTVLYKADLTDEELHTALVQAEGLLNSRPLTAVSTDAADPQPLTPHHFLVGHARVTSPLEEQAELAERAHPHRRFDIIQHLLKVVWRRWKREVVSRLNLTTKWQRAQRSAQVGDVLLCLDDHLPRAKWPLGRVEAVYPGKDGATRVVDVNIRGKVYRRHVRYLVPLEVEPSSDRVNSLESVVKMRDL
ncbi:uncharacterized protein LOC135823654 [Sycon ciliatum]|uniref:uncharacterized protein LOC135823654 n=1 Tax=Sycon ciliatum TaxID=27933 RepID=UPI0031F6598A